MNWSDVDERLPDAPLSARNTHEVWVSTEAIDSVLVHLARDVLGLPTRHFASVEVDAILGAGTLTPISKGLRALAAMCLGRWSVAKQLLDKPLASKPLPNRDNARDASALARQLGTAVETRAPSACVAASMAGLRAAFIAGSTRYDPRLVLVAAHLYLHHIAPSDDVPAACRTWLETGALPEHQSQSTDDVHVKIFETHQQELADEGLLSRLAAMLADKGSQSAGRRGNTEIAIKLFVAGWTLPDGWERAVEPDARAWLGGSSTRAECKQGRDELLYGIRHATLSRGLGAHLKRDCLFEALWLDLHTEVLALSGRGKLSAFKPGKTFGADARRLVRYLAAAVDTQARPVDVAPAWHAFLAGRRPFTYNLDREYVGWREVAMLQSVIVERLGGGKPEDVGATLRATITASR